jgi:uncharacterized protein YegL
MPQEPFRAGFAFDASDFADNPDPRAPCVLVLDTSGSMDGRGIRELNEGLRGYQQDVAADAMAARRVDLAVVRFGETVSVAQEFTSPSRYVPEEFAAEGATPMAAAVLKAIQILEDRKKEYKAAGIAYYRPWIFLFTDGAPTDADDHWRLACEAVRRGEAAGKFTFFAFGVAGADFGKLRELANSRQPLQLKSSGFREFFVWLSASQRRVSESTVGSTVKLLPPTGDSGWGEVPL